MPSPGWVLKILNTSEAGQNTSTVQPWFPSLGAAMLEGDATYWFDGLLRTSISSGGATTSHTTSLAFGGTAVIASILYRGESKTGDTAANASSTFVIGTSVAATVIKAASTSATENMILAVRGIIRITTAGTVIPQLKYSVAPNIAPTIQPNSFFRFRRVGGAGFVSGGEWV